MHPETKQSCAGGGMLFRSLSDGAARKQITQIQTRSNRLVFHSMLSVDPFDTGRYGMGGREGPQVPKRAFGQRRCISSVSAAGNRIVPEDGSRATCTYMCLVGYTEACDPTCLPACLPTSGGADWTDAMLVHRVPTSPYVGHNGFRVRLDK